MSQEIKILFLPFFFISSEADLASFKINQFCVKTEKERKRIFKKKKIKEKNKNKEKNNRGCVHEFFLLFRVLFEMINFLDYDVKRMADARFIRKKEDFKCEKCGFFVQGSGYTNHCPKCLYSQHVDVNPGDRKERCEGMMKPIKIEKRGEDYIITHRCEKCGKEKKNKMGGEDSFEEAAKVMKNL